MSEPSALHEYLKSLYTVLYARCDATNISRLWQSVGQTKPTRVIRLLTEGTIEKAVLSHQRKKLQTPEQYQIGMQLQEAELLAGNTLADILAAHP